AFILNKNINSPDTNINWQNSKKQFLVLNSIIIHPKVQNKGLEKKLIDFAVKKAKSLNYSTLRFKTYGNNNQYIDICNNSGFKKTGEFFSPEQKTPFYCFEKTI
ncbi:MAG: GNAT family N-acetyltransferase, partial [Bacteroidales bacterium]|nr:GNAT family N-acetyltransferase [Bacteroidales bacterium]